jgi:hypothetical protein
VLQIKGRIAARGPAININALTPGALSAHDANGWVWWSWLSEPYDAKHPRDGLMVLVDTASHKHQRGAGALSR